MGELNKNVMVEMGAFINSNTSFKMQVKRINTGSNYYTVMAGFRPGYGLQYSVKKNKISGEFVGEEDILMVSNGGLTYEQKFKLPKSVEEYIIKFYIAFEKYRRGCVYTVK